MINAIPIVGWILSLTFSISLAIPFWICWTVCGIGEEYFYWLPSVYHGIPFWSCVGLFMCISILKHIITPKLANISNDKEVNIKK